ncbi:hypothetical protein EV363DRAFT_1150844 [Boletus edulis]|nr:hypothetical protein EV363DRAFT_1150844 [Boletus edulis]
MLFQPPVSPSQPMSRPHINIPESALVSPGDMTWDNHRSYSADAIDVVTWNYYTLPPSPPASVSSHAEDSPQLDTKAIRPRFTPETQSESDERRCLPTNQVFDLEDPSSSSSVSPPPRHLALSSDNGPPLKKSFSMIGGAKKGRGERITTKDFVPPDVSGLSKREARLLKNRAAAFLSRQRKREEFEAMEIRVKELEEENSRLHTLAEKGSKCDDLLSNLEQLRMRLSVAEKRERELTVELANRTAANLAVKTESHDSNLSPISYGAIGQSSIISIMRESLLSSLPSLLSLPSQTSLPITFSIPLTDSSSTRPDINNDRPRYGDGGVGYHSNSADLESSRKMGISGEFTEGRQFDMDGYHCLGSFAISFDASLSEDGQSTVRVHVSERISKAAIHGGKHRTPSLASWPGGDGSFASTCYASPPLSARVHIPSPGGIDHLGVFAGTGSVQPRMGFDTQLMSSGYTPFGQHDSEQSFDYYPGLILE